MLATVTAPAPEKAPARGLRRPRPLLVAWGIVVLANAVAQPIRAARDLVDTDYVYAFMTAGRMLHQGTSCLYCRDMVRNARAGFLQTGTALQNDLFSNPPLAAWVIQPIALLPVGISFAVFLALSIAAIVAAGVILTTRILPEDVPIATRGVLVFLALTTLPAMQALALVNWNGILVLAVAGSAWAAIARRPVLAGALISVLLVKPQTVWLVPVVLLITLNWRPLVGFALGAATWLISTLLLIGPGQLPAWAHNDLPAHSPEVHQTVGLPGIVAEVAGSSAAGFGSAVILSVIAAVAAWRLREALRADLAATIGLAVAASGPFRSKDVAQDSGSRSRESCPSTHRL